ncbi:MAG: glutathione S-transferase family protein [Candidatus Omnitrophica bacterium]|nr:glutathione S-transferase family protein [Candidatus Omnitrophota bacterium]
MGLLQNGQWVDQWYDTQSSQGKFVRQDSQFRNWVRMDGTTPFIPEKNRYHLYVSLACPWAHRTIIFRKLKKLEDMISLSIVDPIMLNNGWEFSDSQGCVPDFLYNKNYLYELYLLADPGYEGRVTVPVLWDKKTQAIVNNESSDIIRMFNSEFNFLTGNKDDYYPRPLRQKIDEMNDFIYPRVNNGVYRCGFATKQKAYEEAFLELFEALDHIEKILSASSCLVGDTLTEADWRLFTTLIRFDPVYVGHFKCNKKRVADYPHLSGYVRRLFHHPGVKETVHFNHIKRHYYESHTTINPTGIVPLGPEENF